MKAGLSLLPNVVKTLTVFHVSPRHCCSPTITRSIMRLRLFNVSRTGKENKLCVCVGACVRACVCNRAQSLNVCYSIWEDNKCNWQTKTRTSSNQSSKKSCSQFRWLGVYSFINNIHQLAAYLQCDVHACIPCNREELYENSSHLGEYHIQPCFFFTVTIYWRSLFFWDIETEINESFTMVLHRP